MKNTEAAFLWIVGILQKHQIPFRIAGGFAARVYGATRELADIDFDISEDRFSEIFSDVEKHIEFGPARYVDENWDLLLMTLSYQGQVIDIAGAHETKLFDQNQQIWINNKADLSNHVLIEVYGITVPIIRREELIDYKTKLSRDVDKIDIEQLTAISL